MFLPIGDAPNPPKTPYVNYLIIGINIAVFLFFTLPLSLAPPDLSDPLLVEYLRAMGVHGPRAVESALQHLRAYDLFVFRHGFRPSDPSLQSLFTAMFLHAGWLHLAGNMLFLWIFGDNVEHRLGRLQYLLAYLGTGVAATLFFALFVPGSQVPLLGASGAISGVLGFYFLWFPRNQVKTFVFLFPFIMTTFMIPARLVLGFYLLVDNLIPFLVTSGGGSGVAHGAHIGGFLAGLGAAWGLDRLPMHRAREGARPQTKEARAETSVEGDPAAAILASLEQGNTSRAVSLYFELDGARQRRRLPAAAILAVGEALLAAGDYERGLSVFRRFIAGPGPGLSRRRQGDDSHAPSHHQRLPVLPGCGRPRPQPGAGRRSEDAPAGDRASGGGVG